MKLLELIDDIGEYVRIRRSGWVGFLVRSEFGERGLIWCDFDSLQLHEHTLTYYDLVAHDWEIVK